MNANNNNGNGPQLEPTLPGILSQLSDEIIRATAANLVGTDAGDDVVKRVADRLFWVGPDHSPFGDTMLEKTPAVFVAHVAELVNRLATGDDDLSTLTAGEILVGLNDWLADKGPDVTLTGVGAVYAIRLHRVACIQIIRWARRVRYPDVDGLRAFLDDTRPARGLPVAVRRRAAAAYRGLRSVGAHRPESLAAHQMVVDVLSQLTAAGRLS